MRRIFVFILAALLLLSITSLSESKDRDGWFLMKASKIEEMFWSDNPLLYIKEETKEFLLNHPVDANYFASELNISNGEREKNGERLMFGRLVTSTSINQYWYDIDIDLVYEETIRLLFGPWGEKGITKSQSIFLAPYTMQLITADGTWKKYKPTSSDYGIRILHKTDYFGSLRMAVLKLSVDTTETVNGDYHWCQLTIVRKPQ